MQKIKILVAFVILCGIFVYCSCNQQGVENNPISIRPNYQNFNSNLSAVYELIIEKDTHLTFEWQGSFSQKTSVQLGKGKYSLIANSFSYNDQNLMNAYIIGQGLTAAKYLSPMPYQLGSCEFFVHDEQIVTLNNNPLILLETIDQRNQVSTLSVKVID